MSEPHYPVTLTCRTCRTKYHVCHLTERFRYWVCHHLIGGNVRCVTMNVWR